MIGRADGALVGQDIGGNTISTMIGAASGALIGPVGGDSATATQHRDNQLSRYPPLAYLLAPCDDRYYKGDSSPRREGRSVIAPFSLSTAML
ncbi:hypothetical protein [Mesorhizobium amorphae]|uniref:hypothetical protein n=1 Tax=Mesorhizobium amorphae TaxID=71433 RepID=UPI003D13209A